MLYLMSLKKFKIAFCCFPTIKSVTAPLYSPNLISYEINLFRDTLLFLALINQYQVVRNNVSYDSWLFSSV